MREKILVAGKQGFNQRVVNKLSNQPFDFDTEQFSISTQDNDYFSAFQKPLEDASVVFIHSDNNVFPVAEMALKNTKHVVLFGLQRCKQHELLQLLELALESNSHIVNGDSFLFNPIIFPIRKEFENTEITTLFSNRFSQSITYRSIFNCLELLLYTNSSPVKNVSTKVVRLRGRKINVLHTRIEFENGNLAVLELTNCKPDTILRLETAGKGTWLNLDLLSFNGKKHNIDVDDKLQSPEQVYPKQRNTMNNLLQFIKEELPFEVNPHHQFFNSVATASVISKIEDQLRREVPNFVHFNDAK